MKFLKEIFYEMPMDFESWWGRSLMFLFWDGTVLLICLIFLGGIYACADWVTGKSYPGGNAVVVDEWSEIHCSKGCHTDFYIKAISDSGTFSLNSGERFNAYTGIGDSISLVYHIGGLSSCRSWSIGKNIYHKQVRP